MNSVFLKNWGWPLAILVPAALLLFVPLTMVMHDSTIRAENSVKQIQEARYNLKMHFDSCEEIQQDLEKEEEMNKGLFFPDKDEVLHKAYQDKCEN